MHTFFYQMPPAYATGIINLKRTILLQTNILVLCKKFHTAVFRNINYKTPCI